MKIAIIGDTHLGRVLHGYDLTPHIRSVMYSFLWACKSHEVDYAIHLGDVGDRPVWSISQQKLVLQWCNEFERAGIQLYILAGNHDVTNTPGVASALDVVKAAPYRLVTVVDRPSVFDGMVFLPFPSPSLHESDEEWQTEVDGVLHRGGPVSPLIFAHLNVDGARLNQEWVYRGDRYTVPKTIRSVFSGHIHLPQQAGKVRCVGAAARLTFGEKTNRPAFLIVDEYGRTLTEVLAPALSMQEFEFDVSAWTNGGEPPSTDSVVCQLKRGIRGALVKVKAIVDEQSCVDWQRVEQVLYERGARHVAMAPPVPIKRDRSEERKATATEAPEKVAKRFIKTRVEDKGERREIWRRFESMQKEQTDAEAGAKI
jgi:hypothetical protein